MFRDGTKAGGLSSPLLHPASSVPADAAIHCLQFDSSSLQSILDSLLNAMIWMQHLVHVITVCRTSEGCIKAACVCVCPSLSVCLCLHVQAISLETQRRQMREERRRHTRSGAQRLQLYRTLNVNLRWEVCESRRSAGAGGMRSKLWPGSRARCPLLNRGKRTSAFINNLDSVGFIRVWTWTFMCRERAQSMCSTERAEQDDLWHFLFHLSFPVQSVTVFSFIYLFVLRWGLGSVV